MILMLGTDPKGQGGIASVVRNYIDADFFKTESIEYLPTHRNGVLLYQLLIAICAVFRLILKLSIKDVELVHVHCASYGSFWRKSILMWICRSFKVPTIFHLHGGAFDEFVASMQFSFMKKWAQHTLSQSTSVIVLSSVWQDRVLKIAPMARVVIIANSVQVSEIVHCIPELIRPNGIIFLGKADRAKGVFDLVDAVQLIIEKYPNVHLSIAGDGDLVTLQKYVNDKKLAHAVTLLGWIGMEQKNFEISRSRVFCLPAYREGLPMALLESMVQAKAIVTTPVGAIPEVVQHSINGLMFPPGDVVALTRALSFCFDNDEACRRMGEAARITVVQNYSLTVGLEKLSMLYKSIKAIKL